MQKQRTDSAEGKSVTGSAASPHLLVAMRLWALGGFLLGLYVGMCLTYMLAIQDDPVSPVAAAVRIVNEQPAAAPSPASPPPAAPPLPGLDGALSGPEAASGRSVPADAQADTVGALWAAVDRGLAREAQLAAEVKRLGNLLRGDEGNELVPETADRAFDAGGGTKIATFNIRGADDASWPRRRDAVAALLRSAGADVVCLQEVRDMAQLEDLATAAGYTGRFFASSLGLLARTPLPNVRVVPLPMTPAGPDNSDANERAALVAELNAGASARPLTVVATHFSYDAREQCRNVASLIRLVLADIPLRMDVVVAGDLNTYMDHEFPVDALTLPADVVVGDSGRNPCMAIDRARAATAFLDAWPTVHGPQFPGFTFPNPDTHMDSCRADRILLRSTTGRIPLAAAVLGADELPGGFFPSDHRAVLVRLSS